MTGAGGDVLFVEATAMPGERGLTLTGQLGDVMKESAHIALSYLRAHGPEIGVDPAALDRDPKNWLLLRKDGAAGSSVEYAPMLAMSSESLPHGEGWIYEPKWDGFRAIVTLEGGSAKLTSRNGNDLTGRFAAVARSVEHAVRTADAVVDGEICALDEQGRSRCSLLQEGGGTPALVVFDVLEVEGEPLLELPLAERRALAGRPTRDG